MLILIARGINKKTNKMFRKLVANLSFSPSLIHEIGFYARRLRREETTRRLTMLFVVLALVVQSLAVFSPPESANASSEQDLIRGGVSDKADFLTRYDANESNIKDIFSTAGITRDEIEGADSGTVSSKDTVLVMGRFAQFGTTQGETPFSYTKSENGEIGTTYIAPLRLWDTNEATRYSGTHYQAWIGQSAKLGWFAILKNCANLVTKTLPPTAKTTNADIKTTISAINLTQNNTAAETVVAQASDRISYTIKAENTTKTNQLFTFTIPLADILEYSRMFDNGGGKIDEQTKALSWTPVGLAPGQSQQRTFVVQMLDPIPATPSGQSNSTSYDCILNGTFGTSSAINVACPPSKTVETVVGIFPTVGLWGNLVFAGIIASFSVYFYLRTRQLKTEIRLIRHTLNTGAL